VRIRSVKPDFYRDEKLSDLENEYPDLRPMLVFSGLWGECDKQGVFAWNPRTLRLDILPLVNFDFNSALILLEKAELVRRFEHNGKIYGHVINFCRHQRITGSEAMENSKYPKPSQYIEIGERLGNTLETPWKHSGNTLEEWKGREGKGKERKRQGASKVFLPSTPPEAADAASDDDLFPTSEEGKQELAFYHAIEKSFLSKNDDTFTDYGKEGKAIKNLIKKARARAPDSPEAFAAQMIEAFWKLKNSGDKFYSSQPFIPSALNASGIWDRVLETLRDKSKSADPIAMKIAQGEIL
jgi:hypothetical protein